LEEELADLKASYAKKIASVELKCEGLIRDKEDDVSEWYKDKKHEILTMRAGVSIMKCLFDKKRAQFSAQMVADKADFENHKEAFGSECEKMRQDMKNAEASFVENLRSRSEAYEKQLSDLRDEKANVELVNKHLDEKVRQQSEKLAKYAESEEFLRKENESLRKRLVESERTEELARREAQIERLEEELKRTRKMMLEKSHVECEVLRKEIMDYVKFIVQILPEESHNDERIPKEVQEKLRSRKGSIVGAQAGTFGGRDDCWPWPPTPKALPPVTAGGGGGHMSARGLTPRSPGGHAGRRRPSAGPRLMR